ncbi:Metal dependent phosphohydrolase [Teratosphaeria destructans]|uniref:Metal dependent phosphohydrolase n=1 Tax=Teratosphaeria destructans TaxID=418781 RepID=A0A9W7SPQ7_9PEZI|nr:Metal dependent phosphohydrolase [Teratosphaeria destructans]
MTLPTKVIAGVTVPDTPLITKALDFARSVSTDDTYNHIVRSFLLGFVIADKIPDTKERDREAHAVAAILHDTGFPIGHPPHSDVISQDKRFEVDGANAARNFLKREANSEQWDKHRLQLVWDAIALHTIGTVVFHKEPECQATSYGIWADFQGPDRVPGGVLTWDEFNSIVKEFPRLDLMKGLKNNMLHLCKTKPQTTYDNTVGEWGDRYLSTKEYNRQPNLTQNLLETCDLDAREYE